MLQQTICQNSNRATYTNYKYCPTTASKKTENDLVQATQAFQHVQQQNQIIQTQLYNNQVQLNQVSQQLNTEQVQHKNTAIP